MIQSRFETLNPKWNVFPVRVHVRYRHYPGFINLNDIFFHVPDVGIDFWSDPCRSAKSNTTTPMIL